MPQYDFKCYECDTSETVIRSIHDTLERSPYCKECDTAMKRIWWINGIHFKGEGWGHQ